MMAAEDTQSRKPGSASKPLRRGIVTSSKTTVGRETCGLQPERHARRRLLLQRQSQRSAIANPARLGSIVVVDQQYPCTFHFRPARTAVAEIQSIIGPWDKTMVSDALRAVAGEHPQQRDRRR